MGRLAPPVGCNESDRKVIERGSETPAWLTPEIDDALAAISEPHAAKKQTTVLLVAQALATGESLRSVFGRPDTCKADHWYGTTRRNGSRKPGWREDPYIQTALALATERARWWVRVKQSGAVQNSLDILLDAGETAAQQLANLVRLGVLVFDFGVDGGIEFRRADVGHVLEASKQILDRISMATASKSTVQTLTADQFAALAAEAKVKAGAVNEAAAQAWQPNQKPSDGNSESPP